MVQTQILPAIQLLSLGEKKSSIQQNPKALMRYYLLQKRKEDNQILPPLAESIERIFANWEKDTSIAYIETLLQSIEKLEEEQPPYQYQDFCRLENLEGYLNVLKTGSEDLQFKALEQVEKLLLRIHDTYGIAWDFGGVLMDGHNKFFIELYARSKGYNLSKEYLIRLWEIIFKSDPIPGVNYDALKIGQATPEQFARNAIENYNIVLAATGQETIEITEGEIDDFLILYYSHYDPKYENREVLQRLHKLGIRQYGLTNNFMAKIEYFLEQDEFDYLRDLIMIVSEKFGVSKPNPKIYLSFKQHVFLDRFAKDILGVNVPDQVLTELWQAVFKQDGDHVYNFVAYEQERINQHQLSQYVIEQYNYILKDLGYDPVDSSLFADKWLEFWQNKYKYIAEKTIFVDDKIKNLNQAFNCEKILGVHYDANLGQKLANQPVILELLEQENLKKFIRILRELTTAQNSLSQRAKIALERLMPFRIRHEKLIWQENIKTHEQIINTLSDQQIYTLLQRHYKQLYLPHFKRGELASHHYALIHRLAQLPEYNYDEARQIVLELFETSDLFLDQNQDLYPWLDTQMPGEITTDLGDSQERESILKKKLLPELKRKIVDYVKLLDLAQPSIEKQLNQLQTEAYDLETLKQLTGELLKDLTQLKSARVVQWPQIENLFQNLQQSLLSSESQSNLSHQLNDCYHQLKREAQFLSIDLLPLQRMINEWEQDIHELESAYFQKYYRWKVLKAEEKIALYQDEILEGVRERFSEEDIYQFMRGMMLRVYDLPRWKDITKPTIILVSGTSGTGKSTVATHIAQRLGIQKIFSTDEAGRANTKAILDFLFGPQEAAQAFPSLYQSSFEGNMESYYYQSVLTMIGVEGLAKRLYKQNTSAVLEGVGLMPGLLSERIFELLNVDWLIVQVDEQQHSQNFAHRGKSAAQRDIKRYRQHFEMIREIQERIIQMGLKHGLTIIENKSNLQKTIDLALERVKDCLTDQFTEVNDPLQKKIKELLALEKQHLPLKVRFDVKRAALNLGILEHTIIELLHRFGFEPVPNKRHSWMRQPSKFRELTIQHE